VRLLRRMYAKRREMRAETRLQSDLTANMRVVAQSKSGNVSSNPACTNVQAMNATSPPPPRPFVRKFRKKASQMIDLNIVPANSCLSNASPDNRTEYHVCLSIPEKCYIEEQSNRIDSKIDRSHSNHLNREDEILAGWDLFGPLLFDL
jgi:hypothetical protein